MWNGTMFVDLDWPLNASSLLSASAELLVILASDVVMMRVCIPEHNVLHFVSQALQIVHMSFKNEPKWWLMIMMMHGDIIIIISSSSSILLVVEDNDVVTLAYTNHRTDRSRNIVPCMKTICRVSRSSCDYRCYFYKPPTRCLLVSYVLTVTLLINKSRSM